MASPPPVTGMRGIWLGVRDPVRSRAFYELLGAEFSDDEPTEGIVTATLGGIRLIFESVEYGNPPGTGPFLLFDVDDPDALHETMRQAGYRILQPPQDEPWGRQLNVLDPNGYSIALIGNKNAN